jgi:hypothetical protein
MPSKLEVVVADLRAQAVGEGLASTGVAAQAGKNYGTGRKLITPFLSSASYALCTRPRAARLMAYFGKVNSSRHRRRQTSWREPGLGGTL